MSDSFSQCVETLFTEWSVPVLQELFISAHTPPKKKSFVQEVLT